jgi:hypothetical protein
MPIDIPDYDTVVWPQVLAFWRNRFPGKDTHTESFLGKSSRAVARSIMYFFSSLQAVDNDAVPGQKTSRAALNNMAFAYGLPSNLGSYGPNGGTVATGGVGTCVGNASTTFTDGLLLTAPDGKTVIKLSGSVTTPAGSGQTSVNGNFVAVTVGTAGNLATGTVLTWQNPPVGAVGTVTLSSALSGAIDNETSPSLLARILSRWQSPPKGGARQDYRTWSESQTGVLRGYIYPRRQGTGTVDIVITAGGSGSGRKPSAAVQTVVGQYINGSVSPFYEGQRPVTASAVRTLLPYIAATGLKIRVRVVPSASKYAFDWSLGAGTLTVASYNAGTGVLTTNETLPTSLTQAIDTYKASPTTVTAPRLQVMSTGIAAPGIATAVSAVDYNAGAKTITLPLPTPGTWAAPLANDPIYPYGPAVALVAPDILSYVDGLGPSRASGYANELDVWDDTCRIFSLGQVALDATDTDGVTRPIKSVPSSGVSINGASSDVQATDDTNGIQLLTVSQIAVTD